MDTDDGLDHGFVETPSPWTRPGFLLSGGIVALIVVMGIALAITTRGGKPPTDPATPTRSAQGTASPSTGTDAAASVCGLPGHDTTGTLNAPPRDTTWTLVGTIALPATDSGGPGVVEDTGLRYCYAHTPEGAVLAALNMYSWTTVSKVDPEGALEHAVAQGPGYDALANGDGESPSDAGGEPVIAQIRGFRLVSYSDGAAMVDVALQATKGSATSLVHQPVEVAWDRGDWRIRLTPDGSLLPAAAASSLAGFVAWSGA